MKYEVMWCYLSCVLSKRVLIFVDKKAISTLFFRLIVLEAAELFVVGHDCAGTLMQLTSFIETL